MSSEAGINVSALCYWGWFRSFLARSRVAMVDRFPVFDVILKKRGRRWRWCLCSTEGNTVMLGSEPSRAAARYEANKALFLLLLTAPYRSQLSARLDQEARVRRWFRSLRRSGNSFDDPQPPAANLKRSHAPEARAFFF